MLTFQMFTLLKNISRRMVLLIAFTCAADDGDEVFTQLQLRTEQNSCHFAAIFECIFMKEHVWIFIIEFHWGSFMYVKLSLNQPWFR